MEYASECVLQLHRPSTSNLIENQFSKIRCRISRNIYFDKILVFFLTEVEAFRTKGRILLTLPNCTLILKTK